MINTRVTLVTSHSYVPKQYTLDPPMFWKSIITIAISEITK